MIQKQRPFLGWYMVGVGSFCYGFGISPMYYSWGFFLTAMQKDIAISGAQAGFIFMVFSIVYHVLGAPVGVIMSRWGIRCVVVFGSAVAVLAFWLMSRADSYLDCLVAYSVLGGIAIGFATILPSQTLASNWFVRYRARAIAFVLAGGGIVGYFINKYFGPRVLLTWDWRTGWLLIAGISAVVGVVAALFLRSRPEDVGQLPDGGDPGRSDKQPSAAEGSGADRDSGRELDWSSSQAVRSYQFYVLIALSVAYGVPWGVTSAFGPQHLESLGFSVLVVGSILGWRVLASVAGRLSALGGDFITPQRLLAVVLLVEGVGTVGLVYSTSQVAAYASVLLIGLGFGAAYVTIPVTYSAFYGRRAFGTTVGIRFAFTGFVSPSASLLAGYMYDWTGDHTLGFMVMGTICLLGVPLAFWLRHPGEAPEPVPSTA